MRGRFTHSCNWGGGDECGTLESAGSFTPGRRWREVGHIYGWTGEDLAFLTSRQSLHMRPSNSVSSTIFHFQLLRLSKKSCLISGFPHFPHPSPTHPSITDQYKSILSLAGSGLGSVQNQTSQTSRHARAHARGLEDQ